MTTATDRSNVAPWAPPLARRVSIACDLGSATVLATVLYLVLTTFGDYGITWDESWHLTYGDHILSWFRTWGSDTSALCYRIDYMYGGGFDLLGAVARELSPLGPYPTIHLVGALSPSRHRSQSSVSPHGPHSLNRAPAGPPRAGVQLPLRM